MKTMKGLIFGLALFIGIVGIAHADMQGQGWSVTYVTGTATTIFAGRGYLWKIALSSGDSAAGLQGEFLQAFSTAPNITNGGGVTAMPNHLFVSTTALTPPLVFLTTATNNGGSLNQEWSLGDCDTCFVEIPAGSSATVTGGRTGGGLHIRKSAGASGNANQAAV